MKAFCGGGGGGDIKLSSFLTFALGGDEWVASCASRFTPRERSTPVPINGRLRGGGELWSRSGRFGEERNFLPIPRMERQFLGCPGALTTWNPKSHIRLVAENLTLPYIDMSSVLNCFSAARNKRLLCA
jgi:hypothetical protein